MLFQIEHAFGKASRHGQNQRHRHVRRILSEHARRIGHGDIARIGRQNVDIVDAIAEIGNQFEILPGLREQMGIDSISHRGHQNIRMLDRFHELGLTHGFVIFLQARIEQLAHSRFHSSGELACNDYNRLLSRHSFALFLPHSINRFHM